MPVSVESILGRGGTCSCASALPEIKHTMSRLSKLKMKKILRMNKLEATESKPDTK
ncbi:hypothetical protein [Hymenobacter terricola]|uniref:hypothetical protein n=1 Tax=Hymenobacter terricola TaxID=2819236 RepID=UPI001B31579F|nr:hypothetical protein [Hymenobacter terricola]